jgi:hypothetical protein
VVIDERTISPPRFRLQLEPGIVQSGRVVDDRGEPRPDVVIELVPVPSDDVSAAGTSDASGRFQVGPVLPGRYQIIARLRGHIIDDQPDLRLRPGEPAPDLTLRAVRAGTLYGIVTRESGVPLAGASVAVSAFGTVGHDISVFPGSLPLATEAARLPAAQVARQVRLRVATTDARGRFLVDDVAPGQLGLDVAHTSHLPRRLSPVFLGAAEHKNVGTIALSTGALISGRIIDEAGAPIAGARLEARVSGRAVSGPLSVTTENDGVFSLRVPTGKYDLVAIGPGCAPRAIAGFRADKGPRATGDLEIRLARAAR